MTNNTKQKLIAFIGLDSWNSKHPSDMDRFYEFIIEAYKNGDRDISQDEFLEVVGSNKINECETKEWMGRIENGIDLLKVYNKI